LESVENKNKQIEAVYSAIRSRVKDKFDRFFWGRNILDGKIEGPYPKMADIFAWVCEAVQEITQPSLFPGTEGTAETIKEFGNDIYLDEIILHIFPPSVKGRPAKFTLARIALTPGVLATLKSDPEVIFARLFKTVEDKEALELITMELRVEELYQLIPAGRIPPKVYRQGRGDLTYPLAILGKPKPGQNYVTFIDEKNGIKTEAGSMYGVLTEFDFRVLCAIVAFTQRVKDKDGKIIAVARFSQYSIARYLNMTSGKNTWKRITEALKKIATFTISHNHFETKGKNSVIDYKRIWKIARTKKEGENVIDNIFEWDEEWRENFIDYFELIDGNIFGQLGGTEGRLHLHIKRRIGSREEVYSEHWESIADRLPLTGKTRADNKRTFIKACKEHQEITGIAFRIDAKEIAHFTNHPGKTKQDHQIESRAGVEKRAKRIDQAKAEKELTEEQNRIAGTLFKLNVNPKLAGQIAGLNPSREDVWEMEEELKDCKDDPSQVSYVAGGWLANLKRKG